ncbi:hypothetical protein ASG42_27320 [Rhizobium sp. Leaf391]|nr:hypothetical protein ASG42_27320 [Rhizobium sp. Leaf391]KQT06771.1 hypothetical protein ASG50_13705 [Rhizobium sp. Leaf386]
MIGHVVESHGINPDKIFVTGLSAGGAMANVMLATCRELFAGGAIIGGLPHGTADTRFRDGPKHDNVREGERL